MAAIRGLTLAFGLFAGSFALHIVGGATDQGWLFAIAVAIIFVSATGFPALAVFFAGPRLSPAATRPVLAIGALAGLVFTAGALWAANERAFAAWHIVAVPALVTGVSLTLLAARELLRRTTPRKGPAPA
ncbi:MAG: hypothetical protein IT303_19650 [Dehalococcoidia bacterium]|nr:hypothetical protein [Dehalococcoidia bacterium]